MRESEGTAGEVDLPDAKAVLAGGGDRLVAVRIDPACPLVAGLGVMPAQRLDVGGLQAGLRHLAQDQRDVRQLAMREYVAVNEFPGAQPDPAAFWIGGGDPMVQRQSAVPEQPPHAGEIPP